MFQDMLQKETHFWPVDLSPKSEYSKVTTEKRPKALPPLILNKFGPSKLTF